VRGNFIGIAWGMKARRRVVASGLTWERAPETTRVLAERSLLTTFVLFVGRPLWGRRLELAIASAVLVTWAKLASVVPARLAGVVVALVIAAGLRVDRVRGRVLRMLRHSELRRRWGRACRYGLVVSLNDRTPRPVSITDTPAGEVMRVRMPPSMSTRPLADARDVLASGLAVKEVRVERDPNRADLAMVSVIRRDPLGESGLLAWPNLDAPRLSVWRPIPVGVDEMGETVTVALPERNMLVGGEPGAGKSVALSMLVATAALDPRCELFLLDGKRLELAYWRGCAKAAAGERLVDAISVLSEIQGGLNARCARLEGERRRKVIPEDDMPLQVVVCDELAYYLTIGERKETKEFEVLARDIVQRGRAVGIIFVAATQKPSHDVIPTSLRDLFAFRWALRCTTPQASDTILGAGWASRDYSADRIDMAHRGVGYLLGEGALPRRVKSFYLSNVDLEALSARAEVLRKEVKPLRSVA
jgi:hypothetical protein